MLWQGKASLLRGESVPDKYKWANPSIATDRQASSNDQHPDCARKAKEAISNLPETIHIIFVLLSAWTIGEYSIARESSL
jgi:hypothetical protein